MIDVMTSSLGERKPLLLIAADFAMCDSAPVRSCTLVLLVFLHSTLGKSDFG